MVGGGVVEGRYVKLRGMVFVWVDGGVEGRYTLSGFCWEAFSDFRKVVFVCVCGGVYVCM